MQRCLGRCQDKAKETLPASPGDKDIRTAQVWASCRFLCKHSFSRCTALASNMLLCLQGKLAGCYADCAEEYERQLPKLGKDIRSQLRQALSR